MLRKILKEYTDYPVGKYTTSDESNVDVKIPDKSSWGFSVKLQDGHVVGGQISVVHENSITGWVGDGARGEQFSLPKSRNTYFTTFKNKIEKMYGKTLLDEPKAKKDFANYIERTFK